MKGTIKRRPFYFVISLLLLSCGPRRNKLRFIGRVQPDFLKMATKAAIFLMKSFQKVVAPKVFHELKSTIANATNSETLKAHSMQGNDKGCQ